MTAAMMPTAVFADNAGTFKIGVIGPMTGDYAQYGLGVYHAAQLAAEEVNANGGFNGYNVEVLQQVMTREILKKQSMHTMTFLTKVCRCFVAL